MIFTTLEPLLIPLASLPLSVAAEWESTEDWWWPTRSLIPV